MSLLILSGPTGVGKSTLQTDICSAVGGRTITSVTTRAMEMGEAGVARPATWRRL